MFSKLGFEFFSLIFFTLETSLNLSRDWLIQFFGFGLDQFSSFGSFLCFIYTPTNWASHPVDHRSTNGYCLYLGDSLISWQSKKRTVIALSNTEVEHRALADTIAELLWLRQLLADMGVHHSKVDTLQCDNQSSLQIVHNDVFHEQTSILRFIVTPFVNIFLMVWLVYGTSLQRNMTLDIFAI